VYHNQLPLRCRQWFPLEGTYKQTNIYKSWETAVARHSSTAFSVALFDCHVTPDFVFTLRVSGAVHSLRALFIDMDNNHNGSRQGEVAVVQRVRA